MSYSTGRQVQFSVRVIVAVMGLVGIEYAELMPPGLPQELLADVGFITLVIAAVMILLSRRLASTNNLESPQSRHTGSWRWTIIGLGLTGVVVAQSWFQTGGYIAWGDNAPPIGTAWVKSLLSPFKWTGFNLGAPNIDQVRLPWAIVVWVTQLFGGSAALAQRIWFSFLIAAILMAAGALARSLRLSPIAGIVVAVLYFFNPMTIVEVSTYDVYLLAMALIAALSAVTVSHGTGSIPLWKLCVAFVGVAPLLGYVYENPPLAGMVILSTAATPILVGALFGHDAARRSVRGVLIAGALLIAASVYWIVPSVLALVAESTSNLHSLTSWWFSESRSTLANGFWLNDSWAWPNSLYFPYVGDFSHFPLNLIPLLIPITAFSGLALRRYPTYSGHHVANLRAVVSLGTLGIIFLSTGTRAPGNLLFDPLYNLPFGWLLQSPGRFLMMAALGYALLGGLLVEQLRMKVTKNGVSTAKQFPSSLISTPHSVVLAVIIVVVTLLGNFPLLTGAIVNGPRQGFPSAHVKVPSYWEAFARYSNSSVSPAGSLLVLPADDFYAMPYNWYYGNDQFIANLLSRHVIDPNPQGYFNYSSELLSAIRLEERALINHDWIEASRLLAAIGTPLVIVRGDIQSGLSGRNIVSPTLLKDDLERDPEMTFIHHFGTLSLYKLKQAYVKSPNNFATISSSTPNLLDLSLLPPRTTLITSKPLRGHMTLLQTPSFVNWIVGPRSLSTRMVLPIGWRYSVDSVDGSVDGLAKLTRSQVPSHGKYMARILERHGPSLISDGDFSTGSWGKVGNCNDYTPVQPPEILRASTLLKAAPGGATALELTASIDSACEAKTLNWRKGPILLRLWERSLKGGPAALCVWEMPIDRCATVPSLPSGAGWHQFTAVINPNAGTTAMNLTLYSNSSGVGSLSIEQYARISVYSLMSKQPPVIVGNPTIAAVRSEIITFDTGYLSQWVGPAGTTHVLVDGLRNGWIKNGILTGPIVPFYSLTSHEFLYEALLALVMTLLAVILWLSGRRGDAREQSR